MWDPAGPPPAAHRSKPTKIEQQERTASVITKLPRDTPHDCDTPALAETNQAALASLSSRIAWSFKHKNTRQRHTSPTAHCLVETANDHKRPQPLITGNASAASQQRPITAHNSAQPQQGAPEPRHQQPHHRNAHMGHLRPRCNTDPLQQQLCSALMEQVQHKLRSNLCAQEYDSISHHTSRAATQDARLPTNAHLNRYPNVVPYDFNRVRLAATPSTADEQDGYINASYIRDARQRAGQFAYIATQAPLPNTYEHFWHMVMQNKCPAVVKLWHRSKENPSLGGSLASSFTSSCSTHDSASSRRSSSHSYFPDAPGEQLTFGSITVTTTAACQLSAEVLCRTIQLHDSATGAQHTCHHYHHHTWPDFGVPSCPQQLLQLSTALDQHRQQYTGPIVVHCKAGIGRTGSFCAFDMACRRIRRLQVSCGAPVTAAAALESVDMQQIVKGLKEQRAGMVQTRAQYRLCYEVVARQLSSMLLCLGEYF